MEGILIVNGSPRATRSNSKLYAEAFMKGYRKGAEYMNLTPANHHAVIEKIASGAYREVLFVFPLYADGNPLDPPFFMEGHRGGRESPGRDEDVAHRELRLLRANPERGPRQDGASICQAGRFRLCLFLLDRQRGSDSGKIFRHLIYWPLRRFGRGLRKGRKLTFSYTMPISKRSFLRASTKFWLAYGARNGIDGKAMSTPDIEK